MLGKSPDVGVTSVPLLPSLTVADKNAHLDATPTSKNHHLYWSDYQPRQGQMRRSFHRAEDKAIEKPTEPSRRDFDISGVYASVALA
ncbi:MAG: hypothetical protein SLRJCFUN_000379 [Candidatus Fervidibacter sp.]